jgi:hypothetical protein
MIPSVVLLVSQYQPAKTGAHDVHQSLADRLANAHGLRGFLCLAGAEEVAQVFLHVDNVAQDLF